MDRVIIPDRGTGDRNWGGIPILLLGISLALAALQLLHFIVGTYALIFDESWWYGLTTPGEPEYDPDWKLVVGLELLMGLAMVPLLAAVLVSFARRQKAFIRLAILWLAALFLVAIVDNNLIALIPALHKDGTLNESAYDALRAGFAALVWIPYLMFSKRIKRVFVG
jgi:hypothetical protein